MTMELQIWVLTGLVGVLFAVLLYLFKVGINRINVLISEVHQLNITTSDHRKDIDRINDKNMEQDKRLHNHADRLREIEMKLAKNGMDN